MKPNPKNFDSWTDPNGGEWIRMKNGIYEGVCWRPVDMELSEDNQVTFQCEFFGEVPTPYKLFEKTATAVVHDILQGMMNADQ